jgi:hypothetical protein
MTDKMTEEQKEMLTLADPNRKIETLEQAKREYVRLTAILKEKTKWARYVIDLAELRLNKLKTYIADEVVKDGD